MSVTTLDRPLYSIGEAAQFLSLPSSTLRRWLEGVTVEGVFYPPVIRPEPTGGDSVTWGEFVEAGFLREYRHRGVPLQDMRPFIDRARARLGAPYPLAHMKPLIEDKRLVYDLQREADLPEGLYLVRAEGDQEVLQLQPPVEEFILKVEFTPAGQVGRFKPLGKDSPLAIDPEVSFGIPQIHGVRAENVAESVEAGEEISEVADDWGLSESEVAAAVQWQGSLQAA